MRCTPSGVKQPHCHQALAGPNWLTDSPPGEVLADGVVSPVTATVPEALTVQWSPPKHVSASTGVRYAGVGSADTNWLSQRRFRPIRVLCRMSHPGIYKCLRAVSVPRRSLHNLLSRARST